MARAIPHTATAKRLGSVAKLHGCAGCYDLMMMMPAEMSVADSYRYVRRVSRRSGSTFYRSFWLLPKPKRHSMCAVYAFARMTDDLGDCDKPTAERTQWLQWWREITDANIKPNGPRDQIVIPAGPNASTAAPPIDLRSQAQAILPALRDTIERYSIPPRYLLEIVDGVVADQQKTRFETFEQLEHFCYLAAASVGLACLHIWGFERPLPIQPAIDCGLAFQLTNIIRDVSEDTQQGRIYLPRQHYERHGLCEDDLLAPRGDDRFRFLIADEIQLTKQLFASGWKVWDSLHHDGRPMFSLMWRTYRHLLDRIAEQPASITNQRVRVPSLQRWTLLTRHAVPMLFHRLPVPPLEVQS